MKKGIFLCAILAAVFLSMGLSSVSAPEILITPINKTISVVSNETFVLAYKMNWDEPDSLDSLNFFSATISWDSNESDPNAPYLNFTYIDYVCKYTNGTDLPLSGWDLKKAVPSGYPSTYFRYMLMHYQWDGVWGNGEFWLNVTMRAAGVLNGSYVPHVGGDQNITIVKVRCNEETPLEAGPGDVKIHVRPRIFSCDQDGNPKDVFNVALGEAVYVKGYGFGSGARLRLYVVQNTTWTDGQSIGADVRGTFPNMTNVDSGGNLTVYRLGLLPLGYHDIVADASPYVKYNNATDAVDDVSSAPGITVVPEFSYGIAVLIMSVLAVLSVAVYIRNRKLSSFI